MTKERTAQLDDSRSKTKDWHKWGPYLSERQWGTVREDYSPDGDAWNYFSHEDSRSRAYRWGEDGIAGISDRYCNICFGIALWNGKDPILKERLFGLTGPQGNHGEDVKELYYYLENTPTHSYMKHLYKYPQNEFPYVQLVEENRRRGKHEYEYELLDTGILDNKEYFEQKYKVCPTTSSTYPLDQKFVEFRRHARKTHHKKTDQKRPDLCLHRPYLCWQIQPIF